MLSLAMERGVGECAICMTATVTATASSAVVTVSSTTCTDTDVTVANCNDTIDAVGAAATTSVCSLTRPVTLLSCSHIFHKQCMENLESFMQYSSQLASADASISEVGGDI